VSVVIATRGSKLALWQSNFIMGELVKEHKNESFKLEIFKTKGDKILDTPLALIGGKGLFTKELEEAMLKDEAKLAVHSLKDMPTELPEGLVLGAITLREDDRDAMLSEQFATIDTLPQNAVVGTTSLRRRMQLLAVRPDLVIKDLRGNIDTRIQKLKDGEFDAIILASAGIKRLGIISNVKFATPIDKDIMTPSMGQAALGIETRCDFASMVSFLNDSQTELQTRFERAFVDELGGGCQAPIGVNAETLSNGMLFVRVCLGMPDGTNLLKESFECEPNEKVARELAKKLLQNGADKLLSDACAMGEKILRR
jgi:hydroxymethylbilane synthase